MLCANDADCTELEGIASSVFLYGMRPLRAGCDGRVSVAFSIAEEAGLLAHTALKKAIVIWSVWRCLGTVE